MAARSSTVLFEWAGIGFEWDAAKNDANAAKHGISFENAARAFGGPMLKRRDERRDYGEERWIALGAASGLVIAVVYTPRSNRIRVVSARKANRREKKTYREAVAKAQVR